MKTVLEESSVIGTVVNPGKVEVDEEETKPKSKDKETPEMRNESETDDETNVENNRKTEKSFEDINEGFE